ncbi:hypothetical protein LSAT2_012896 [Lamellibrachia satsuma]|nr:hypothetical protein LSAT2_012896 [Lamellibrachia satsuma]
MGTIEMGTIENGEFIDSATYEHRKRNKTRNTRGTYNDNYTSMTLKCTQPTRNGTVEPNTDKRRLSPINKMASVETDGSATESELLQQDMENGQFHKALTKTLQLHCQPARDDLPAQMTNYPKPGRVAFKPAGQRNCPHHCNRLRT